MAESLATSRGGRSQPARDRATRDLEISWRTIGRVLLAAIFVWMWLRLWHVVMVVLVATVLAVTAEPLVAWLERHRLRRGLAAILLGAVILGLLSGFVMVTWTSLAAQAHVLADQMQSLDASLANNVPPQLAPIVRRMEASIKPQGAELAPYVVQAFQAIASAGVVFALGFVLTIYLLVDGQRTFAWVLAYVPRRKRHKVRETAQEVQRVMRAYVVGNIATSCLAGIFMFVTFWVLGVPAALLLALLAAICDFVPVLGLFIAAVPALALASTVSAQTAVVVALLFIGYHVAENYAIGPKIYGDRLKLSDVGVILAFAAGLGLGGIVGALLALPLAAAYPCVESLWLERTVGPDTVEDHETQEWLVGRTARFTATRDAVVGIASAVLAGARTTRAACRIRRLSRACRSPLIL